MRDTCIITLDVKCLELPRVQDGNIVPGQKVSYSKLSFKVNFIRYYMYSLFTRCLPPKRTRPAVSRRNQSVRPTDCALIARS